MIKRFFFCMLVALQPNLLSAEAPVLGIDTLVMPFGGVLSPYSILSKERNEKAFVVVTQEGGVISEIWIEHSFSFLLVEDLRNLGEDAFFVYSHSITMDGAHAIVYELNAGSEKYEAIVKFSNADWVYSKDSWVFGERGFNVRSALMASFGLSFCASNQREVYCIPVSTTP